MSKVTIEDISRHTGLSRGTVSRALNNRPDISAQTKQRVLEACRDLKYVPSHAARSLATGRCYAVAVVVEDLRTPFSTSLLRGVLDRAQAEMYAVHVSELGADPVAAVHHLCTVANERVDGVLLGAELTGELTGQLTESLDKRPLVACADVSATTCDTFLPDYVEAGRLVARRMLRGPGEDVLYVHEEGTTASARRLDGFREICSENGTDPDRVTVSVGAPGADRLEAVRERLRAVRAVAASDDFLAIEVMCLAREVGRQPGRDLAVIGQGNTLVGTRISPALTTVDPCGEEIGRRAMDMAVQRVTKARQDAAQRTLVAPLLIERDSTRTL